VLVVMLVIAVLSAALTWLAASSDQIVQVGRAQTVADLVALAGAVDGARAATEVAAANGARLVGFDGSDDQSAHLGDGEVAVRIRLGKRTATARAALRPLTTRTTVPGG
jgi:hypothetical protein